MVERLTIDICKSILDPNDHLHGREDYLETDWEFHTDEHQKIVLITNDTSKFVFVKEENNEIQFIEDKKDPQHLVLTHYMMLKKRVIVCGMLFESDIHDNGQPLRWHLY